MSKYTDNDVIEGESIAILKTCLNQRYYDTSQIKEQDKTPDVDGTLRLRDGRGSYLNIHIFVQVKGHRKVNATEFRCKKEIVEFAATSSNPFLLFIVDVQNKIVYWHFPESKGKSYRTDLTTTAITDQGIKLHSILNEKYSKAHQNSSPSAQVYMAGASRDNNSRGEIKILAELLDKNLTILDKKFVQNTINNFKKIGSNYSMYCYWLYSGNYQVFQGRSQQAKVSYNNAIRIHVNNINAISNLALIYCLDSKPKKALTILDGASRKQKKTACYWGTLGLAHALLSEKANDIEELKLARRAYERSYKLDSKNSNIAFNLLRCLNRLGSRDEYESFKAVCKKRYLSDYLIANDLACDHYQNYCNTLLKDELDKMEQYLLPVFNTLVEFSIGNLPKLKLPKSAYNRQLYQCILDNTAACFFHKGEKQKAVGLWQLLVDDDPTYKSAHQNLAIHYISIGNPKQAIFHLKNAEGNPNFNYQTLGGALIDCFFLTYKKHKYKNNTLIREAKEYFRYAYDKTKNLDMLINEAVCVWLLGDKNSALRIVSKVKQDNPNHYFSNLKSIHIRLSGKEGIVDELEKLTDKFPDEYFHLFDLGNHYSKFDNISAANKSFLMAVDKLLLHPMRIEDLNAQNRITDVVEFLVENNKTLEALSLLEKCIKNLKFVDKLIELRSELIDKKKVIHLCQ